MKNKNITGILALFFGALGIHRFYLGQIGLGIFYLIFLPISWLISFIDAIVFFSMDKENFNIKYNKEYYKAVRREVKSMNYKGVKREKVTQKNIARADIFKSEGKEKFRNYDYQGALENFNRALEFLPNDLSVHFNLACTYSLLENNEKGMFHLDRAVANGFDDYDKIRTHEALSYLRVHPSFKEFEQNGYRLIDKNIYGNTAKEHFDLEEQIEKLSLLKERGLLTTSEYLKEKEKLLNK